MHIALVNQWYPPDYGGVAVYTAAMARSYIELGHKVTVVTARSRPEQATTSEEDGVLIRRLDRWIEPYAARRIPYIGRHVRSFRHLAYALQVRHVLRRLARTTRLDVVEFAEINAEGLFYLLYGGHIPAVVRCHTPHFLIRQTTEEGLAFDPWLVERAERTFVRHANAVTAPSSDLARRIECGMGLERGRVLVVPNAIDVSTFSPGPDSSPGPTTGPITILYAGRLERHKGIFVLAEALARLERRHRSTHGEETEASWRAIFAGEDRSDLAGVSNREQLREFFEQQGIGERVDFRGFVSQDELVQLYRSVDICVVPSLLYESFSYTSVQAMSCGKPVVATTTGGIPEVVVDGVTGILVPPGDAEALARSIAHLLNDPALRMRLGQAGRNRAVSLYDRRIVARQNLVVYESAIDSYAGERLP